MSENTDSLIQHDDTTNPVFYGHTMIYLHRGYSLLDADGKTLMDSDGNNLICA